MNSTRDNLFVVVAIVLTFAVGMATFLNYYKFNSVVGGLMQSRVNVIANEIRDNVEKNLALGLSFQENNVVQGLIERELRADDLLKSIVLFDTAGTVLYSTESLQQRQKVDEGWLKCAEKSTKNSWFVSERESLVTGVPIRNNFGITLGYVAIKYSRKPLEHSMGIIGNILLQTSLLVLMFFVIVTFCLLLLTYNRYRKELLRAENELTLLVQSLDGAHPATEPEQDDSGVFMRQIHAFSDSVRSAAEEIEQASAALRSNHRPS